MDFLLFLLQIYSNYLNYSTILLNFVRENMRRLKKKLYLGLCGGVVAALAVVRGLNPGIMRSMPDERDTVGVEEPVVAPIAKLDDDRPVSMPKGDRPVSMPKDDSPVSMPKGDSPRYHPIRSVPSYNAAFPDVQDVQIVAAMKWGVRPVKNRRQAEERKSELVYIGSNPFYDIDPAMQSSIPYLVPRASDLLYDIGRNFLDSLYVKGVPLHKIIVSSVLRTEDDVARLLRRNGNASEQSCHRFGTTFDICYNRYTTVSAPGGPQRRAVQNDTLKWVLSEVLRDVRQEGRCYIKHEVKQGCFHITVR